MAAVIPSNIGGVRLGGSKVLGDGKVAAGFLCAFGPLVSRSARLGA